MTVIRIDKLKAFWMEHPEAERALLAWLRVVQNASWKKPTDVLQSIGSADVAVPVGSGKRVVVFDIRGNKYRLVAAVDYRAGHLNVLKVMTHAEYSRNRRKRSL